ncbi:MAG: hypothetical protein IJO43_01925 [Bacilli bacterium]|nr:hypothetical protein [Bacilli bacterium]
MLITDPKTTMKLSDRLSEFSKFGMTFYYLLEEGKVAINEIEDIFFSKDDEKSTFRYINMMRRIMPEDVEAAFSRYQDDYPRGDNSELDHANRLNMLFTGKIINEIAGKKDSSVDRTYINTYNYLLDHNEKIEKPSYSYGK